MALSLFGDEKEIEAALGNDFRSSAFVEGVTRAAQAYSKSKPYLKKAASRFAPIGKKRKPSGKQKAAKRKVVNMAFGHGKLSRLETDVDRLKRCVDQTVGTMTYRQSQVTNCAAANSAIGYRVLDASTPSQMETALGNLKYYDPSTPGTLVTAAGASGTFSKPLLFESAYVSAEVRANYQQEAHVSVYLCRPRGSTDVNVNTAFTNGLTDSGAPTASSPLVYPTDSSEFNALWVPLKTWKFILAPGQSRSCGMDLGEIKYDPAVFDSSNEAYSNFSKSCQWFIRVRGPLCHDTVTLARNFGQTDVDIYASTVYKICYPAGINLDYTVVADGGGSFANAAVSCLQNQPDLIGYSAS